jgi:succinyl-diaminopimelate desuccinylase
MTYLSDDALMRATKGLLAIESTADNPKGLRAALDYMRQLIINCGKDITIEEFESGGKPSFLAYRGPIRPEKFHIILNGHIDVVPGKGSQFVAIERDGKLYGRGAYDMKAAAVVLANIFCEFVDTTPYPLALQIVSDEEDNGHNGTDYQIAHGVRGNFVICGDCGRAPGTYTIANEAKGNVILSVMFKGRAAHGAYPWHGDNAALKAADFVRKLHSYYPTPAEETGETTVAVTSIFSQDNAKNQIPDRAVATINARYKAGDPNFASQERFLQHLKEIDSEAEVVEVFDFSSPLLSRPDNPLLQRLKAAAENVEGRGFTLVRHNGTSDGRFYGAIGNEACEFGIAGVGQHSDNEYITLDAFYNYLKTMRMFLQETLDTAWAEQPISEAQA